MFRMSLHSPTPVLDQSQSPSASMERGEEKEEEVEEEVEEEEVADRQDMTAVSPSTWQ